MLTVLLALGCVASSFLAMAEADGTPTGDLPALEAADARTLDELLTLSNEDDEMAFEVECTLRPGQDAAASDDSQLPTIKFKVFPSWAELGSLRVRHLVETGMLDGAALFRVVPDFLIQFGVPADPKDAKEFLQTINDDERPAWLDRVGFQPGMLSFAGYGENSRTHQLFVGLATDPKALGGNPWETPVGYLDPESRAQLTAHAYAGYGDMAPFNEQGVDAGRLQREGESYVKAEFPRLTRIDRCRIPQTVLPKGGYDSADSNADIYTISRELLEKAAKGDPNDPELARIRRAEAAWTKDMLNHEALLEEVKRRPKPFSSEEAAAERQRGWQLYSELSGIPAEELAEPGHYIGSNRLTLDGVIDEETCRAIIELGEPIVESGGVYPAFSDIMHGISIISVALDIDRRAEERQERARIPDAAERARQAAQEPLERVFERARADDESVWHGLDRALRPLAPLVRAREKARAAVQRFFNLTQLFVDATHITRRNSRFLEPGQDGPYEWRMGYDHGVHADNCYRHPQHTEDQCIKKPYHCCFWRDYTAVLLLNSGEEANYTGAEFFFQDTDPLTGETVDTPVPGKCGRMVMFASDDRNMHGVKSLLGPGHRWALAMWLTTNPDQVEEQRGEYYSRQWRREWTEYLRKGGDAAPEDFDPKRKPLSAAHVVRVKERAEKLGIDLNDLPAAGASSSSSASLKSEL